MRSALIRGGVAGLAGVFGVGFLTVIPGGSTPGTDAPVMTKREQSAVLLETVDEDDDDDLRLDQVMLVASRDSINTRGDRDRTRVSRESRFSRDTRGRSRDKTNSKRTPVSRDRDRSRADKTRDWTMDGGEKTRDRTPNSTNDRSRHDTRWGRN